MTNSERQSFTLAELEQIRLDYAGVDEYDSVPRLLAYIDELTESVEDSKSNARFWYSDVLKLQERINEAAAVEPRMRPWWHRGNREQRVEDRGYNAAVRAFRNALKLELGEDLDR